MSSVGKKSSHAVTQKKNITKKNKSSKSIESSTYLDNIFGAINQLHERNGSSRQAIAKYVSNNKSNYASHFLNKALRDAVTAGKLVQIKGSYKLPSQSAKKKKEIETLDPTRHVLKKYSSVGRKRRTNNIKKSNIKKKTIKKVNTINKPNQVKSSKRASK